MAWRLELIVRYNLVYFLLFHSFVSNYFHNLFVYFYEFIGAWAGVCPFAPGSQCDPVPGIDFDI